MDTSFVIRGDICYSEAPNRLNTQQNGYLVCLNGRSGGVFPELPEKYANLPLRDCQGMLVLPGLVDLHLHAPQYSFRGLGMDLELLDWLNQRTFPEEAKFQQLEYADRAYSLLVEDLTKGFTTRACLFATIHLPATMLLMKKLEASGLATMVGKVNMDRNSPDELREESPRRSAEDTIQWIEKCGGFQRTRPILTPRFIPSCSDELMEALGQIQRQYGLPLQSHLSENRSEIDWVKELSPQSRHYGDAYARFGLFGGNVPTIMAHCVWSEPEEVQMMKEQGVFVAHCPQSNENLCSGIAPARAYLENGLAMGLGSDMAGGCHTSIFRAMADAIQVSKLYWRLVDQSASPLTAEEAFYLGTVGGGAFFGKVGSFEEGYELDAVVIRDSDYSAPFELSIPERLARTIYLSDDRNLVEKYVQGRQILGEHS